MTSDTPAPGAPPRFTRSLSGFGVIILTLSVLSPGVSVLVSGGSIVQQAGTGAVLAFLIGAVVCFCQTTMIAELGAAYPSAGYDYAAIGHSVGDWACATTYFAGTLTLPLFLNTSAVGIALYLHPFGLPFSDNAVTFGTIALITALALLNIRSNEYVTGVFMAIETAALLLVAALGAWHAQPDALARIVHPIHVSESLVLVTGIGAIGIAINNASWAIAGASQALYFSEDMKRPETIGRIIMLAFLVTVALETLPVLGLVAGAHDVHAVFGSDAPFETFLARYLPPMAMKLMSAAIAIAIFNACLAGFIGTGRNVFAQGRTAFFAAPVNRALMRLIPSTQAPWVAILAIGISTALATYLPMAVKLLLLSGNTTMLTMFYAMGVWKGRRSGRTGRHDYRSPLFPLMPIMGLLIVAGEVVVLWLDADMGRKSLFVCLAVYALGLGYYRFVLRRRPGGWRLRGPEDIDAVAGPSPSSAPPPPVPQALPTTA